MMKMMSSRRQLLCTFVILQCLLALNPAASSTVVVQDETNELSSTMSRNNLRQPLHLQQVEDEQEEDWEMMEERPRRQLWDFWSIMMLIHPPCPPADSPHRPPHCKNNGGSGSSGSGSSSSSSSAAAATSSSSSSSSSASAANSAQMNAAQDGFGGLGWYAIPVFFSVCTTAYAVAVGSRRKPPAHNLSGALSRRVVATGAFADHTVLPTPAGPESRFL